MSDRGSTQAGSLDVHAGGRVAAFGARPESARAAVILLHGRGATAESILTLAHHLGHPDDVAYLAPQAVGNSWYLLSFLAPLEANEPYLSSALGRLGGLADELAARGVPAARTVLAGFSQGACLVSETAARRGGRWGGVAAFTGGVLGPADTPRDYAGRHGAVAMDGTPVFLGAGDPDPHVPWARVEETAAVFRALGAAVTLRRYPGLGHTVNDEEMAWLRGRLDALSAE